MEGCVCVCGRGHVEERENHSEPTSCIMTKYAEFKLLPPSSLLWALTADHLWTLTVEHSPDSDICTVFIHVLITLFSWNIFFPFLFHHFHQHTGMLFWLLPVDTNFFHYLYKNPHWKTFLYLPSPMTLFHSPLNPFQSSYLAPATHSTETALFKSLKSHCQIRHSVLNAYSTLPFSKISKFSYCKQCRNEHWGACIFLNYGFLWINAQKRDFWIIW